MLIQNQFSKEVNNMEKMPKRDTTGNCEGECRDRVNEGEEERQQSIASQSYNEPSPNSPSWTKNRKEQPAVHGGRV
jgi:hypothetical protein